MKNAFLIAAVSGILFSGAVAAKHKGPMTEHRGMVSALRHLPDITDAQRDKIKQILLDAREQHAGQRPSHDQRPVFANENAFLADYDNYAEQRRARSLQKARTRHAIYLVLNETQRQELVNAEGRRQDRHQRRERRTDTLHGFRELDISDAQRIAIKAIMKQARTSGKAIHQALRQLKKDELALIHAEEFDEADWNNWFDNYASQKRQAALLRYQTRSAIDAQLTDEQRQKLTRARRHAHAH